MSDEFETPNGEDLLEEARQLDEHIAKDFMGSAVELLSTRDEMLRSTIEDGIKQSEAGERAALSRTVSKVIQIEEAAQQGLAALKVALAEHAQELAGGPERLAELTKVLMDNVMSGGESLGDWPTPGHKGLL